MLNTRLKELEGRGVILKRRLSGQRGHEYRLTAAGRELSAVIEALAVWGMRWARNEMAPDDPDVTFLMFDIQRRIDTDALPDGESVICFSFSDLDTFGRWWLVCNGPEVDLCYADPGKDVDLYVSGGALGCARGYAAARARRVPAIDTARRRSPNRYGLPGRNGRPRGAPVALTPAQSARRTSP